MRVRSPGHAGDALREVKDLLERCEFDASAEFLARAYSVTDLDSNGLGEVTFAYKLGCRSDVSPITLKLIMLEDGKKHILRGTTRVHVSDSEEIGGSYRADPSFATAPRSLQHAIKTWNAVVSEL